jgi:hypothetical protein
MAWGAIAKGLWWVATRVVAPTLIWEGGKYALDKTGVTSSPWVRDNIPIAFNADEDFRRNAPDSLKPLLDKNMPVSHVGQVAGYGINGVVRDLIDEYRQKKIDKNAVKENIEFMTSFSSMPEELKLQIYFDFLNPEKGISDTPFREELAYFAIAYDSAKAKPNLSPETKLMICKHALADKTFSNEKKQVIITYITKTNLEYFKEALSKDPGAMQMIEAFKQSQTASQPKDSYSSSSTSSSSPAKSNNQTENKTDKKETPNSKPESKSPQSPNSETTSPPLKIRVANVQPQSFSAAQEQLSYA